MNTPSLVAALREVEAHLDEYLKISGNAIGPNGRSARLLATVRAALSAQPSLAALTDEQIEGMWEDAQCDRSLHSTTERVVSCVRAALSAQQAPAPTVPDGDWSEAQRNAILAYGNACWNAAFKEWRAHEAAHPEAHTHPLERAQQAPAPSSESAFRAGVAWSLANPKATLHEKIEAARQFAQGGTA